MGREVVVKLLLWKSAKLESNDEKYSRTPLSWAANHGHEAVVRLLLEKELSWTLTTRNMDIRRYS